MSLKKITENIFCVNVDLDESISRFEGIWAIPSGVTINSYIVKGNETALIDVVLDDAKAIKEYEEHLAEIGLSFGKIDHLILNHLEPDHTGFLTEFRKLNPSAKIYASKKGIAMVKNFFKIDDNLTEVKTGDTLDLGNSVVLKFFDTPNVHWPETMMTYCENGGVLFSCDGFGGYGKLGEKLFDDEHSEESLKQYEHEALRYYSNIMSSFSSYVIKAIDTVSQVDLKVIAPSHGIIWRKNPQYMIDLYRRYAGYNKGGACEKEVCVIYGSMYGFTKRGVDAVIKGIEEAGMKYTVHQVPDIDASYVLADSYKATGLVIAMPTYEYKMFPPMAHILDLFERKHFTDKIALRVGSWGWSGGAKKEYESRIEKFKWDNLESYEWQGIITAEDEEKLKELGKELCAKVSEKV
ncbi:MAG: MBL fold metallo-hydrolase [Treponema sp.]|nr:MAG: MBL fold metallo-hydrolase [Treponema sp.]